MSPVCIVMVLAATFCSPAATPDPVRPKALRNEAPVYASFRAWQGTSADHPVRNGLITAVSAGAIAGMGACKVVDRLHELPGYGCALLGAAHALPVGFAASLAADRRDASSSSAILTATALGGAIGGAFALAYANGDQAIYALPPSAAALGLLVGLIARGSLR